MNAPDVGMALVGAACSAALLGVVVLPVSERAASYLLVVAFVLAVLSPVLAGLVAAWGAAQ